MNLAMDNTENDREWDITVNQQDLQADQKLADAVARFYTTIENAQEDLSDASGLLLTIYELVDTFPFPEDAAFTKFRQHFVSEGDMASVLDAAFVNVSDIYDWAYDLTTPAAELED